MKAPPTKPTGPRRTAPATEAPAALISPFVFSLASLPCTAVNSVPSIAGTESKVISNAPLRPKERAFFKDVIVAEPTVPAGTNNTLPSITFSATVNLIVSPS